MGDLGYDAMLCDTDGAIRPRGAVGAARAAGWYVAVRAVGLLVLLAYGHAAHRSVPARLADAWDGGWYVRIARTGYAVSNGLVGRDGIPYSPRAFFPLYPGLAAALHRLLPIGAGTALLLVSAAAGTAAAVGIHACAALCHGDRAGVVAAVLWGVLPLAALENMAYSEALFTAFAAWALYAVLTQRWLLAGALCVLAGLTRPTAMVLGAAFTMAALLEARRRCRDGEGVAAWFRPLAAAVLSPLGWAGYLLWTGWAVGSWGGYFHIQRAWGSSFDGGVSAVRRLVHLVAGASGHPSAPAAATVAVTGAGQHAPQVSAAVTVLAVVVMVATLLGCLALFVVTVRQRQPLALLLYSAGLLVMDLGNSSSSPPLARFLLPAVPLLFPLAAWFSGLRSWRLATALLGACALLSAGYGIVVVFTGPTPA
jgi:hypothetical protein